jgi:hypothetical protein
VGLATRRILAYRALAVSEKENILSRDETGCLAREKTNFASPENTKAVEMKTSPRLSPVRKRR